MLKEPTFRSYNVPVRRANGKQKYKS